MELLQSKFETYLFDEEYTKDEQQPIKEKEIKDNDRQEYPNGFFTEL